MTTCPLRSVKTSSLVLVYFSCFLNVYYRFPCHMQDVFLLHKKEIFVSFSTCDKTHVALNSRRIKQLIFPFLRVQLSNLYILKLKKSFMTIKPHVLCIPKHKTKNYESLPTFTEIKFHNHLPSHFEGIGDQQFKKSVKNQCLLKRAVIVFRSFLLIL